MSESSKIKHLYNNNRIFSFSEAKKIDMGFCQPKICARMMKVNSLDKKNSNNFKNSWICHLLTSFKYAFINIL